jgi:uncharacterized protein (DUF1501 family)
MNRDTFIRNVLRLGAVGATNWLAQKVSAGVISGALDNENDHVLVLIQLIGGNDGLNTIIPINHWDQLVLHRGNVLPNKKDVIQCNNHIGFHPSAKALHDLMQQQKMCIIQGVGYENPNRSHFRSMDIWNTASPSNQYWTSGWLGRYLDIIHPNYPTAYPNIKYPDPLVVSIGNDVAETCQGNSHQFSYALSSFSQLTEKIGEQHREIGEVSGNYNSLIDFLSQSAKLTNALSGSINTLKQKGKNYITYPNSELAAQLGMVAQLINAGAKTKVYTLTLGGFDTHAYQVDKDNPNEGNHPSLLRMLGDSLTAFLEDLKRSGNHKRVLGMVYSEFGRQIKSNKSFGTDHGDAAPVFIFGDGLKHQNIGDTPNILEELPDQAGINMNIDFKQVYFEILQSWFKLEQSNINKVFMAKDSLQKLQIF